MQGARHGQCRGVTNVVGVGLEGRAEDRDLLAGSAPAQEPGGERDGVAAPAEVDGVHFGEELHGLTCAELGCACLEGPDVLG